MGKSDEIGMEMSMDVHAPPGNTVGMDRDMSQDAIWNSGSIAFPKDPDAPDFLEADINIFLGFVDVVVTPDESLLTHQPGALLEFCLLDRHITQDIDMILRLDDIVPVGNHDFVHLFSGSEGSQGITILPGELCPAVGVPEVDV